MSFDYSSRSLRILLVQPYTPDSYWTFRAATWFTGTKSVMPPLGLITVAALFPQHWQFRLVDQNVEQLTDRDIQWADYVFVTGMIVHRTAMEQVLARCVALGVEALVGGPFVLDCPDAAELRLATCRIRGEMESPEFVAQLVGDLAAGTLQSVYTAPFAPSLGEAPIPRFDLVKLRRYNSVSIQLSRGCPQLCKFCTIPNMNGAKPRYKTPAQVLAELQKLYDMGYRGAIFVTDDNFIGNVLKARELVPYLVAWQQAHQFPFSFYTEADLRLAEHQTLVEDMVAAGFFAVFMGIESPDPDVLKAMKKRQNLGDLVAKARQLRQWGLIVYAGFIVGNDEDTPASFEAMEQFVEALNVEFAMAGLLQVIPGAPLYKEFKEMGREVRDIHGDQFVGINFDPRGMTHLELYRGYRRLLEQLYTPANYFGRARRAIQEWNPGPSRKTTPREYRAVPLSFLIQGVASSYRREYWKFMLWVMREKPQALGRAFAAATSFEHFHRFTHEVAIPQLRQAEEAVLRKELAAPHGPQLEVVSAV